MRFHSSLAPSLGFRTGRRESDRRSQPKARARARWSLLSYAIDVVVIRRSSTPSSSRNRSVQSAGIGNLHRELGRRDSERLVLRWIWLHLESFLVYSHFNDNREQFHEAVSCSVDTHRHDYRIEPYSFYRNSQQSLILIHSKSQSHPTNLHRV